MTKFLAVLYIIIHTEQCSNPTCNSFQIQLITHELNETFPGDNWVTFPKSIIVHSPQLTTPRLRQDLIVHQTYLCSNPHIKKTRPNPPKPAARCFARIQIYFCHDRFFETTTPQNTQEGSRENAHKSSQQSLATSPASSSILHVMVSKLLLSPVCCYQESTMTTGARRGHRGTENKLQK